MSELPPGFVLDGAPATSGGGLPEGFVLDNAAPREGAGLVTNFGTGFNDALYGTIGAVVDLPVGAYNLGTRAVNAVAGTDIQPLDISARRSLGRTGEYFLGIPNPERIEANTTGEKIARGIGEGVGYAVAPELAIRGGVETVGAKVSPYIEAMFGRSASAGDVAANAVVGGASGGAGTAAAEAVPDPWKPYAALAGGLLGAGAGATAAMAPQAAYNGARVVGDYFAPTTAAGQERVAAQTFRDAASDPYAVREALDNPPAQLVPGSQPTTFQQTGDMGLGGLERQAATRDPDQFMQRRADQNQARVDTMQGVQREGSPEAVVNTLRQNLADLDSMTSQVLDIATANARGRTSALGGESTPEGYGLAIRGQLDAARQEAKTREKALWDAVDPEKSLALPTNETGKSALEIARSQPKSAKPLQGEERSIFLTAAKYANKVMPFREVSALRSRVSDLMSEELSTRGRTQVYARLSQLRGAIERDLEGAVSAKAAQEQQAVASGAMREEDTMLAQWAAAMSAGKETWLADRAGRAGQEAVGYPGGFAPAGSSAVPVARGGQGQGRGGPNDAPSAQGIPGTPSGPTANFDEAAYGRMRAASDATKARARTYDQGPVGDVMSRSASDGPFRIPESVVPSKFFRPGPRGYQDVQALRTAVNTPEANAAVRDYALSTLRKAAERPDGTLDPAKVQTWRDRHEDALRAFPEINQMVKGPVEASEAMARVAVDRKQMLDDFNAGAVGRLIDAAPEDVSRKLGAVFSTQDPVKIMRRLEAETRNNPEASQGLRKGIADWINQRFVSNTEAGTSGQALVRSDAFQQFMRQHETTLRVIFKPEEVSVMKAIAADLQRANRSITAVKLPGQSNTAQDLTGMAKRGGSKLGALLTGAGAGAGAAAGGPLGAMAAGWGANTVQAWRQAGLKSVDDIITDAMLNPERARALLSKMPDNPKSADMMSFAQRYRRGALQAAGTASAP